MPEAEVLEREVKDEVEDDRLETEDSEGEKGKEKEDGNSQARTVLKPGQKYETGLQGHPGRTLEDLNAASPKSLARHGFPVIDLVERRVRQTLTPALTLG